MQPKSKRTPNLRSVHDASKKLKNVLKERVQSWKLSKQSSTKVKQKLSDNRDWSIFFIPIDQGICRVWRWALIYLQMLFVVEQGGLPKNARHAV